MSAKELSMERQNRIIQARQAMERGEVSIPDYHKMLLELGLCPQEDEGSVRNLESERGS